MIQAHVICCNDSIEFVFIGEEYDALGKCYFMRDDAFKTQYYQDCGIADYEEFCSRYNWHIHSVDFESKIKE